MDTTSTLIKFDNDGVCNFCKEYEIVANDTFRRSKEIRATILNGMLKEIKTKGKNKKYDCIIGMSGGMDSSYLAIWAYKNGLRPLVVHFDNGWDSELAVQNIKNIINKCEFELYTYVVNWEQFKNLQLAYFRASVIDIEVPTDQLILAALYKIAKKKNIKSIISGNNLVTEEILPKDWLWWNKWDLVNLKSIYKQYGEKSIKGLPSLSKKQYYYYTNVNKIKTYTVFDKLGFELNDIKEELVRNYNYNLYEYKHYESIFTRFYQGYILPQKFLVDKRKAHLSNLIMAGFVRRQDALEELKKPTYPLDVQQSDKEYIIKKWEMTENEFDRIMKLPPVPHENFGVEKEPHLKKALKQMELIFKYKILKPVGLFK